MRFVEVRRETRTNSVRERLIFILCTFYVKRRASRALFARLAARHPLIFSSSQNGPAMKFVHGKKT